MRFTYITLLLFSFLSFTSAALIEDFSFSVSDSVSVSSPRSIPFYLTDNVTIIGQASIVCNGAGEADLAVNVSIDISIQTQVSYSLTSVYVWLGPSSAFPTTPSSNWNGTLPSGGVTKVIHNLSGNTLHVQFTLEEYEHLLIGPKGIVSECLRVAVVIDVRKFCHSETDRDIISYSPPGCDYSFEALYPAPRSYFQVAIHESNRPAPAGNHSVSFEGWCVKPTVYISANQPYQGQLYSTYDPLLLNSAPGEFVEFPQNFPVINYLINHEQLYTSPYLSAYSCNWQDIQNAIWTLVYPTTMSQDPSLYLPNSTAECTSWIVSDALAHGRNYTPPCPGGKYLMLIFPISDECDDKCMHDNDTQIIVFVQGGTCNNNCKLRHCHHTGIPGGSPNHPGCHDHQVSHGNVVEDLIVFDVCLEAKCLPPSPTPCPSYSSAPSQSSTPTTSHTSCPSHSNTFSPTSAPSTSNTPAASYSSSSAPSQSPSSAPSQSSTSAPSQSSTPAPSQSNTPAPSQSNTPAASSSNTPSTSSRPVIPTNTASHTAHPSHSPCPPPESHTSYPSHSPISESSTTAPSLSHTSHPSYSPCPPSESHTPFPSHSTRHSHSPSETSRPVVPSGSHTPYPSHSPCPAHSNLPHGSHTPHPSHSQECVDMGSRSPSPSMCSVPEGGDHGHPGNNGGGQHP